MRLLAVTALVVLPFASTLAEKKSLLLDKEDHPLRANTKVVKSHEMKMSSKNLELSAGDLKFAGSMASTTTEVVHGTALAPDRVRYLQKSATTKTTIKIAGNENAQPPKEEALLGVPVILEKRNGKWSGRLEKGEATKPQEDELGELEDRWNTDDDAVMYGFEPRRIGETWEVDAAKIPGLVGQADGVKGKITLTLVKEIEVADQRCALLKGKLDCTALRKGEDDDPDIKYGMKGDLKITRSLLHFDDISFELVGQMTMIFEGPSPQGPMVMTGDGPFSMKGRLEYSER